MKAKPVKKEVKKVVKEKKNIISELENVRFTHAEHYVVLEKLNEVIRELNNR